MIGEGGCGLNDEGIHVAVNDVVGMGQICGVCDC